MSNVRAIDSGWTGYHYVRDTPGNPPMHLAGRDDSTPSHRTYPTGYDSKCSWCWLGAHHSEAAHELSKTIPAC